MVHDTPPVRIVDNRSSAGSYYDSLKHKAAGSPKQVAPEANVATARGDAVTLQQAMASYRRQMIQERLRIHHGNVSAAARSLGMDRGNFYRLLKKLDVQFTQ